MATTLEPGVGLAPVKSGFAFIKATEKEFSTVEVTTAETGQNSLEPLEFLPNTQDNYGDLDISELAYWWSEEDNQVGMVNAPLPIPDAPIMNLPNLQPSFGGAYNNPIPFSGPF